MTVYLVNATGHNGIAYRTLAEAEAERDFLARILGLQCGIVEVRSV